MRFGVGAIHELPLRFSVIVRFSAFSLGMPLCLNGENVKVINDGKLIGKWR